MASDTSGVTGLDDILVGGFARGRLFLLEGQPGHRQDDDRARSS